MSKKNELQIINTSLERMRPQLLSALPTSGISVERIIRLTMSALQVNPKLLECDRQSLLFSVLRAAQLGIEPDGLLGQGYLVPYKGKVQLIIGYKGLLDLCRRAGDVLSLTAQVVYSADDFGISWHQETPFHHNQCLSADRGNIIGFWACARLKGGGVQFEYIPLQEVLGIRDRSAGWISAVKFNSTNNSPWHTDFEQMGKKTAIRRLAKYLPLSVQKAIANEELMERNADFTTDSEGEIILEGEEEAVQEAPESTVDKLKNKLKSKQDEPENEVMPIIENNPEPEIDYMSPLDLNKSKQVKAF